MRKFGTFYSYNKTSDADLYSELMTEATSDADTDLRYLARKECFAFGEWIFDSTLLDRELNGEFVNLEDQEEF